MISSVFVDKTEYSRYHLDLSIITVTIQVNNPVSGDTMAVSLFRLDGYGAVTSKTITLTSATSYTVTFDLNKDTYDSDNIYRAKSGDYEVQVTDSVGNVTSSPMFAVSIVPVREIKEQWAQGVTFYDYTVTAPRVHPQNITGVTIYDVSQNHRKGVYSLSFVSGSPNTLSWDNGPTVNINGTQPQQILLLNKRQSDYIMVQVDPSQLPKSSASDSIVLDYKYMEDRDIIKQVRMAQDNLQQDIITKIEPEIIDTDAGDSYTDQVGIPETYYRPTTFNKWMNFKLPFPNILDLSLTGYFNQGKVATVPREWIVWNERTGIVELVPSNASQVVWSFYNGIFVLTYLYNYSSIPGFWHYRLTCGLRDLYNERAVVREAIAKMASLDLLVTMGTAYRAGFSSESTSRDGVSDSKTYTSSATYGIYSAQTEEYSKWLKKEIPIMKRRFIGVQYITI